MNIGIDVDGVLVDLDAYQEKHGCTYFRKDIVNEMEYDVQDIFAVTRKERQKFWFRHIFSYCTSEPVRDNAPAIIHRLRDEGHKIHIITGRVFVTQRDPWGWLFRRMLFRWLEKNKVTYDSITLCSERNSMEEKLLVCKRLKIDLMIEDKRENVNAISNITHVLCFDARYNRDCAGSSITRIYEFDEVLPFVARHYAI